MSPELRAEILFVHGGDADNLPFLYFILQHVHGAEFLKTLKRKCLRGKLLTEFIQEKCKGEPIRFLKFCMVETMRVNSPKTPKAGAGGLLK